MDGRQEREQTFKLSEENGYQVEGALMRKRKREYFSPVNVQSIKVSVNENFSTLLDFVFFGFLA